MRLLRPTLSTRKRPATVHATLTEVTETLIQIARVLLVIPDMEMIVAE